jgi:hypothetical protein
MGGAAVVAAIALLAWMATSVHALVRQVDRIHVTLFGEQGRGGYEGRFERIEADIGAEAGRRHKLANRVHGHAGRLMLLEQRLGIYQPASDAGHGEDER